MIGNRDTVRAAVKEVRGQRTNLLDGHNLLSLVVDRLIDGAETPGAELLEESVLARGITAGHVRPWLRRLDSVLGAWRWRRRLGELLGLQTMARVRRARRRVLLYETGAGRHRAAGDGCALGGRESGTASAVRGGGWSRRATTEGEPGTASDGRTSRTVPPSSAHVYGEGTDDPRGTGVNKSV